jgi:hypothetical protein
MNYFDIDDISVSGAVPGPELHQHYFAYFTRVPTVDSAMNKSS